MTGVAFGDEDIRVQLGRLGLQQGNRTEAGFLTSFRSFESREFHRHGQLQALHPFGFPRKLIEHLLVGELLKQSWRNGDCTIGISRPEVDRAGYDLIVECNGHVRHVQLKAAHLGAKAARQSVQISLGAKPSGCVVWVFFDPGSLELGPFMFFGGEPGKRLPGLNAFKTAKHAKGNAQGVKAEKPNHRYISKGQFTCVDTIGDLWCLLFGDAKPALYGSN